MKLNRGCETYIDLAHYKGIYSRDEHGEQITREFNRQ